MSEDNTQVNSEGTNTDQKNTEVDLETMTPDELETYTQERRDEVAKLNSIITRKGDIVKDLNDKISEDVSDEKEITQTPETSERLEKIELKTEFGYSDEVLTHVMEIGGKEALNNPIAKKVADQMQKEINDAQAANIQGGPQSSIEQKFTQADLEGMTSEELEKILPHKN